MTISHKLTLFNLVLARLIPYRERMNPDTTLDIEFKSDHDHGDMIRISVCQWQNAAIVDSDFFTYNFDRAGEISINDFIDHVIETTTRFYN